MTEQPIQQGKQSVARDNPTFHLTVHQSEIDEINQGVQQYGTRSDYARWLHQQQPELTASQIAARVGLNVSSVRRAIKVNK